MGGFWLFALVGGGGGAFGEVVLARGGVHAAESAAHGAPGGVAAAGEQEGEAVVVETLALLVHLDAFAAAEGLDARVDGPGDGGDGD